MSQEIPGITLELREVAVKPARLTSAIRAVETGRDTKDNFAQALEQFKEYRVALYAARITLAALAEMGAIGPDLDLERFQQEVDKIRLQLGLPPEPSTLNDALPVNIISPEEES